MESAYPSKFYDEKNRYPSNQISGINTCVVENQFMVQAKYILWCACSACPKDNITQLTKYVIPKNNNTIPKYLYNSLFLHVYINSLFSVNSNSKQLVIAVTFGGSVMFNETNGDHLVLVGFINLFYSLNLTLKFVYYCTTH